MCWWFFGLLLVFLVAFDLLAFSKVKRFLFLGFSPTLTPSPSLAPLGERGELGFEFLQ